MDPNDLVQPIVVARTGTHEHVVTAVAAASVAAWLDTSANADWEVWLSGRFTKTVRRPKKNSHLDTLTGAASDVTVGDARAVAFTPVTYDAMPAAIRRMRVDGCDHERTGTWQRAGSGPTLFVNAAVPMTTGKTAAQAAHALFAWALQLGANERADWYAAQQPFTITELAGGAFDDVTADVTITDAGLTEIEAGTTTFKVRAA